MTAANIAPATLPVTFRPLSEAKGIKLAANERICRLIVKGAEEGEKKSAFAVVPEVSINFVQALMNNDSGAAWLIEQVQSLQDQMARKHYLAGNGFVPMADMFNVERLAAFAAESSEVRLTKDSITAQFNAEWQNSIASGLALSRSATFAAKLAEFDTNGASEEEAARYVAAFWSGEEGQKFIATAKNYLQFLLKAAGRNESFSSQGLKDKVMTACEMLEDSALAAKMISRLREMPVATEDSFGL